MIAFLGLVWRRLTVGRCEDVGTLLDEWDDERARRAAETTARLDQGLTLSSYAADRDGRPVVRVLDAEAAATLRRERLIAALLAEFYRMPMTREGYRGVLATDVRC